MLRRCFNSRLLCPAAGAAAAVDPVAEAAAAANLKQQQSGTVYLHNAEPIKAAKGETPEKFSFAKRYEQLRADPNSALASDSYEAIMKNLSLYDGLLREYSVKQTEMERAKRAARMCGLEMTKDPFEKMKSDSAAAVAAAEAQY